MTLKTVVAIVACVSLSLSGVATAAAADKEALNVTDAGGVIVPMAPMPDLPKAERPAMLPALYVTLGAMQAWDAYSTRSAIMATVMVMAIISPKVRWGGKFEVTIEPKPTNRTRHAVTLPFPTVA